MFTTSASFIALLICTSAASAADCTRRYTIKRGDTCDTIAAANNVSTYQLAVVNPSFLGPACANLGIGESICLGTSDGDCKTTHVVQAADTCVTILQTYNINATMLWANNPNIDTDCQNIYKGEVLCVANGVQVPPAPASGAPTPHPSDAPASTTAVPSAAPTDSGSDGDDDDDDDLPFCDEL